MVATTTDWVGQKISNGRYEISKHLGEGGMGFVYLAHDSRLETDVVIKVPHREMMAKPDVAQRFVRESKSLVKLTHPHIVKIMDVGQYDQLPFIVMQYLSGGDLEGKLSAMTERGQLPDADQISHWLMPIAKALDFIHEQGYIHRDIKPANIIFDGYDNPFLSDFGIAKGLASEARKETRQLTSTGMAIGTPGYMAPELIMGQEEKGASDQYSLAVLIYEALCGQMLFDGPSVGAIMVQHAQEAPPIPLEINPSLTQSLSDVILTGLAKDPSARYATVTEFVAAIAAAPHTDKNRPDTLPQPKEPPTQKIETKSVLQSEIGTQTTRKVPCPQCKKVLTVTTAAAGKAARCPGCTQLLRVSQTLEVSTAVKKGPATAIPAKQPQPASLPPDQIPTSHSNSREGSPAPSPPIPPVNKQAQLDSKPPFSLLIKAVQPYKKKLAEWATHKRFLLSAITLCLLGLGGAWLALSSEEGHESDRGPRSEGYNSSFSTAEMPKVVNFRTNQGHPDIATAIRLANPSDILLLADGIYLGGIILDKPIRLQARHTGKAIIDARGAEAIFWVEANVQLEGLHLTNGIIGVAQRDSNTTFTCTRCIVSNMETAFTINNKAGRMGNADIYNCVVIDCHTGVNVNDGGSVKVINSIFDNTGAAFTLSNAKEFYASHNLLNGVKNRANGPDASKVEVDVMEIIDQNPRFVDPRNENLLSRDFRLKRGSPAIATGIEEGPLYSDNEASYRRSPPNRGAFER